MITPQLKPRLHAYMGGIVHQLESKAITINGPADHVHLLLSLSPTRSISEILQKLKANSSRWVNDESGLGKRFAWQEGYGAFAVSHSNAPAVIKYIQNQDEHHRRVSFKEEFLAFLKKNGIPYDERYIWE